MVKTANHGSVRKDPWNLAKLKIPKKLDLYRLSHSTSYEVATSSASTRSAVFPEGWSEALGMWLPRWQRTVEVVTATGHAGSQPSWDIDISSPQSLRVLLHMLPSKHSEEEPRAEEPYWITAELNHEDTLIFFWTFNTETWLCLKVMKKQY